MHCEDEDTCVGIESYQCYKDKRPDAREFEILRMILEAKTTDEIASAFHVSRKTMANYHDAASQASPMTVSPSYFARSAR